MDLKITKIRSNTLIFFYSFIILFSTSNFAQTTLYPGDLVIFGYNVNVSSTSCSNLYSTDDVIGLVTLVDILPGTKFLVTDKGFIYSSNSFGPLEGILEFTRTGGTIAKGSYFYIATGSPNEICGNGVKGCGLGWTVAGITNDVNLDLNSNGDQLFVMQGNIVNNTLSGNFIYALNTDGAWLNKNSTPSGSSQSNLPPSLECLNIYIPGGATEGLYNKTGFGSPQNKSIHIANLYNSSNWNTTSPTSVPTCPQTANFSFAGFNNPITINPNLANGGSQQDICSSFTVMSASGTGVWSLIKGSGTIVNTTLTTTTINGIGNGENIFRWTLANCAGIFDVQVNRSNTPTLNLTINTTSNNICTGAGVNFTATSANLGGGIAYYNFLIDDISVQNGNNNIFNIATLKNGQAAKAILSVTGASCLVVNTASSNIIVVTVNPIFTPTVSIAASSLNICANNSITFTASSTNEGNSAVYQWKKSGINVGPNSIEYETTNLLSSDIISLSMTASGNCLTINTVVSNVINNVTVNSIVSASVSLINNINSNIICAGDLVVFSALGINTGNNPTYKWRKNNTLIGDNLPLFSINNLTNKDVITVELISNAICTSVIPVKSNMIEMIVNNNPLPTVTLSGFTQPACTGFTNTITAMGDNLGSGFPVYIFKIDNIIVQNSNSRFYTANNFLNGQSIRVEMSVNGTNCLINPTANSNRISTTILGSVSPNVTILSTIPNPICEKASVLFTSVGFGWGINPLYSWQKNDKVVGTNEPTYIDNDLQNLDVIKLTLISNLSCTTPSIVGSNLVTIQTRICEPLDSTKFFIPDLFSPNNDNKNDFFVLSTNDVSQINFRIYNRAGNLVYSSTSIAELTTQGWDGKTNGVEQPIGSYMWQLSGKFKNGNDLKYQQRNQGIVQLLK